MTPLKSVEFCEVRPMNERDTVLKQLENSGHFRGRQEYIRFIKGEKLTQREAIIAHCYDCMGYYEGGTEDCESQLCPLRPFMPYASPGIKHKKLLSEATKKGLRDRLASLRRKDAKFDPETNELSAHRDKEGSKED